MQRKIRCDEKSKFFAIFFETKQGLRPRFSPKTMLVIQLMQDGVN